MFTFSVQSKALDTANAGDLLESTRAFSRDPRNIGLRDGIDYLYGNQSNYSNIDGEYEYSQASMYLSMHCDRHLSSELPSDVPGFVTHLEKHFSLIFCGITIR